MREIQRFIVLSKQSPGLFSYLKVSFHMFKSLLLVSFHVYGFPMMREFERFIILPKQSPVFIYGVATISRLLKIIGLFCRM